MFEHMTDGARKVMALANQEAQRFNHDYIGTEHILLALANEQPGTDGNILVAMGIDPQKVVLAVEALMERKHDMVIMSKLEHTSAARSAIKFAIEEARDPDSNPVIPGHLLLGLCEAHDDIAARVIASTGLTAERIRETIRLLQAEERLEERLEEGAGEHELVIELSVPGRLSDDDVTKAVEDLVTVADGYYRAIGGSGLKVGPIEVQSEVSEEAPIS